MTNNHITPDKIQSILKFLLDKVEDVYYQEAEKEVIHFMKLMGITL